MENIKLMVDGKPVDCTKKLNISAVPSGSVSFSGLPSTIPPIENYFTTGSDLNISDIKYGGKK